MEALGLDEHLTVMYSVAQAYAPRGFMPTKSPPKVPRDEIIEPPLRAGSYTLDSSRAAGVGWSVLGAPHLVPRRRKMRAYGQGC